MTVMVHDADHVTSVRHIR